MSQIKIAELVNFRCYPISCLQRVINVNETKNDHSMCLDKVETSVKFQLDPLE